MMPARAASEPAMRRRGTTTGAALLAAATVLALSAAAPAARAQDESDPWEGLNRGTFAFNEWLDEWVLVPVATGWDFVAPEPVQTGIANVFDNAGMSVVILNDVLQLKPMRATEDIARLAVNTTVGIGGIFDVATMLEMPENDEDFGQTLGYWGVPPGPYLVLPIFGPSNPRDTLGLIVDTASEPWTWFVELYISFPVAVFEFVNLRTIYLEEIEELHDTALDYYVFQRNAYVQARALAVADEEAIEEEEEDDLYYFDEDEFEEEETE